MTALCTRADVEAVLGLAAGGIEAWAVTMPMSDRGPRFTELVSESYLRRVLNLETGDRLPVRLDPDH